MHPRGVQAVRLAAVAALALAATGCAAVFGGGAVAPSGLAVGEDRLRQMLVAGQAHTAFNRLGRTAPDDEMLRALYHGVVAYHAGDYAEGARVLDIAAHIADERMTRSLSREALSFITSDVVLPYEPGRTERLMIPYYAALARIRMGDVPGAAVEARRLSLLLQQFDDRGPPVDASLRATLRYFTGAVFEANGERNDADVAYRNAVAIDSSFRHPGDLRDLSRDSGTVVVIVEQGFVAHRVEQALSVLLLPEEVEAIAHGAAQEKAAISAFVAGRILEHATYASSHHDGFRAGPWRGTTLHVPAPERSIAPRTRTRNVCTTRTVPATGTTTVIDTTQAGAARRPATRTVQECVEREEEIEGLPYLLRIAWPVYRSEYRPVRAVSLAGAGADSGFGPTADLSRAVVSDFERQRALLIARTIARGTAKLALAKGAERSLEEKNEVAGRLVGLLGNISNVLTERADTRSWHLLPAGISVVRVRMPAGEHELSVELGDGMRALALGTVTVQPGGTAILPVRAW
jgi:hypothetical protein